MDPLLQLVIFFVPLMVVWYFLLIRPQRRRQLEHRALIDNLKRGDEIVTAGGICGIIKKVEKDRVIIDVGGEDPRMTLTVMKDSVVERAKAA